MYDEKDHVRFMHDMFEFNDVANVDTNNTIFKYWARE